MKWIVLLHVVSAIIGIGPAFFSHVLLRKKQTIGELRVSMKLNDALEFFPKIGGSIAVLSGLLLVIISDWAFKEFWIWASLVVYVIIQVLVIGFVAPRSKKVTKWLVSYKGKNDLSIPPEQQAWLSNANKWLYAASLLGILLFSFMVLKPLL